MEVNVGSPGQKQTLALDTGSSDVWLLSATADLCTDAYLQEDVGDGCASTCKYCLSMYDFERC